MGGIRTYGIIAILVALTSNLYAQESGDPVSQSTTSTGDGGQKLVLAQGTTVHLQLSEDIASNTYKRGDRFKLRVVEPVIIHGTEVIHRDAYAEGQVVDARKPGISGAPGVLILTARFVQAGNIKVKLRSYSGGTGKDRLAAANAVGVTIGFPAMFIKGRNVVVPTGMDVFAQVIEDTVFSTDENHQEFVHEDQGKQ